MKKPIAKLNPLECELCRYRNECTYGQCSDELYRAGLSIDFRFCGLYNGGTLFRSDSTTVDVSRLKPCELRS